MISLFLCLAFPLLQAQEGGVQFTQGTWQEILELAEKEDKLVFMDAYTTWCGPCKKMSKEVFPTKTVGSFFNENFINVKMDMEQKEGKTLGDKYNVFAYPTLLFLASDGTLVHRIAGYHTIEEFIEQGTIALDPERNMAALVQRYEGGDRDPAFLMKYTRKLYEGADVRYREVADAYAATNPDWSTKENMRFILSFCDSADSPMFDELTSNRQAFVDEFGTKEVIAKIQQLIYSKIYDTADSSSLDQIDALFEKAYPEKAAELSSSFRMSYYRQLGDREGFANSAISHYAKYPSSDPGELNDVAWTFYEVIDDEALLQEGLKLALQSRQIESGFFNNDTIAALYYKLGNKKKAKKYAKKAIKIAKKTNQDYSLTKELLEKIADM